jgi:hypothetical protein
MRLVGGFRRYATGPGTAIMHLSKYSIFKMIDYLVRDRARSAQLNTDDIDDAIRRFRFAAGFSATEEAAPQSETTSFQSTADYYSVIARAVSRLPNNTREARQALYDRAGVALAAELLHGENPVSDAQLVSERIAFERAIRKVEYNLSEGVQPGKPKKHRRSFLSIFKVWRV